MTLCTRKTVPTMLGAIALALSLSLVGCGSSTASNTDAAKTESTEADSTTTKTETTDKATDSKDQESADNSAEKASEASRSVIGGVDESAIKDFEAMPKSDGSINMFDTTELVENDTEGDAANEETVTRSNGVDDVITRYNGGITIDIPMNWEQSSTESGGRLFQCPDYRASIVLASDFKKSGQSYNVEAMAKAIPEQAQKNGVKNIKVVGYDPLYSGNNNYVGGEVMYTCEANGLTVVILDRIIESKNYVNLVEVAVAQSDVEAHARQLQSILDSCKFSTGEAI